MGLSASEETLPYQLFKQKVLSTKLFALCFRVNGGILTLGGVDSHLHQYHDKRVIVASTSTEEQQSQPQKVSITSSFFSAFSSSKTSGSPNAAVSTTATTPVIPNQKKPIYLPSTIQYAKLLKAKGWFTVKVLDIFLTSHSNITNTTGPLTSIGGTVFKCNAGKGTIVDSGTTDTYLPQVLHTPFVTLFRKFTNGLTYKNEIMHMTLEELKQKMPIIVIRLESIPTAATPFIDIPIYPESYFEQLGPKKFVPRIYLTEANGAVLGANFMNDYNVIFDIEQQRVGFAASDCLEEFIQ